MSYLFINPNSTQSMTSAMLACARAAVPGVSFEAVTSHFGPPAIEGPEDGALAVAPLLALIRETEADGIAIGCFDDTGLLDAAGMFDGPVIGIGQAAFHTAALRNWRFSVVTTLPVSVGVIEDNIAAYGLSFALGRVRASGVPVLALETDAEAASRRIVDEASLALHEDGVDCIVLGCAGMATLTSALRHELSIPVVDPVEAAAKLLPAI
ncbi:MAG: aspartate/glutamate racemase family protein [Pseudomonadota bacterium]